MSVIVGDIVLIHELGEDVYGPLTTLPAVVIEVLPYSSDFQGLPFVNLGVFTPDGYQFKARVPGHNHPSHRCWTLREAE